MGMRMPWQQGEYTQTLICGFIYFICHLHAPRASADVPASAPRVLPAPERRTRAFSRTPSFRNQSAWKRPRRRLNKLLDFYFFFLDLFIFFLRLLRVSERVPVRLVPLKCSSGPRLLGGMSGERTAPCARSPATMSVKVGRSGRSRRRQRLERTGHCARLTASI